MVNIDYILDLLNWNKSNEEQLKGIKLARNIKCINVFLQPGAPYGMNIWENCAKILSEKTDLELSPYLIELMEWLQDLNWPGALCIFERLQKYSKNSLFEIALNSCIKHAKSLNDNVWISNLYEIDKKR